jgi:hypothetical protein
LVGLWDLEQAEEPQAGIYYDDCYSENGHEHLRSILIGTGALRRVRFV